MYDLPYFKERDQQAVLDFIRRHPFAMLIGSHQHAPVATQVPGNGSVSNLIRQPVHSPNEWLFKKTGKP